MAEFTLDTGTTETHEAFDALPDIARGYLEAAFFCGVYDPTDDTGNTELDGVGLGQLDPDSLASMVADAVRFQRDNAADIAEATDAGSYDLEAVGRDFWYNRNGHGVGFWDRDLGDVGDRLDTAAQGEAEADLYAERAPVLADGVGLDEPESWVVSYSLNTKPLEPGELESICGPAPVPLATVGGRYGAPMGRGRVIPDEGDAFTVYRVTLDPGGYDAGGAYWGIGAPLWRAVTPDGETLDYARADDRGAAVAAFKAGLACEVAA